MRRKTASLIIMLTPCLIGILSSFSIQPIFAEIETTLYVDPFESIVLVGNDFTINVTVADVIDLLGFSFYLGYDTIILDFLSVWVPPPFETPIVTVEPEGYIQVSAMSSTPVSGTGELALISFNAKAVGECLIDLYDTILFDSTSSFIPHTIVDGYVTVSSGIMDPLEALEELIETIESWNLPQGTENSLISKLRNAIHLLNKENQNGAIRKLMCFIDQADRLRDKKLTDEQADYLALEAQRIINLING